MDHSLALEVLGVTGAKDVWTNETNQGMKKWGRWKVRRVGWREREGNRRAQRRTEEAHGGIEGGVSRVDVYMGAPRRTERIGA